MAKQVSASVRKEVKEALQAGKQLPSGVAVSWNADGLQIEMIESLDEIKPEDSGNGSNAAPLITEPGK